MPHRLLLVILLFAAPLGLQLGCGGGQTASSPTNPAVPSDILEFLRTAPGITDVAEGSTTLSGARFYTFA